MINTGRTEERCEANIRCLPFRYIVVKHRSVHKKVIDLIRNSEQKEGQTTILIGMPSIPGRGEEETHSDVGGWKFATVAKILRMKRVRKRDMVEDGIAAAEAEEMAQEKGRRIVRIRMIGFCILCSFSQQFVALPFFFVSRLRAETFRTEWDDVGQMNCAKSVIDIV